MLTARFQSRCAAASRTRKSVCCRAALRPQPHAAGSNEGAAASRRAVLAGGGAALAISAFGAPAQAALKDYLLVPDTPIAEVAVTLGTPDGEFVFDPSTVELTQGQLTRLKLSNPSSVTHYFTAFEFAEKCFTVMVLAGDPAVEVKGGIQEVALKAGASATWVLVPMKAGTYPLRCTVKGHSAMVGSIVVKRP